MRVESNANAAAVSSAGALGLMQVMPATFAELRRRYSLGADPFDVRDNILAGTAYLRELYDRYGKVGMLAAYNAGPGRWDDYLATGRPLPAETRRYLARLAPLIGADTADMPLILPNAAERLPEIASIFVARSAGTVPLARMSAKARSAAQSNPDRASLAPSGPPNGDGTTSSEMSPPHKPGPDAPATGPIFVAPDRPRQQR